jgi:hypothetical protein
MLAVIEADVIGWSKLRLLCMSFIYLLIKSTHQQRACSTTGLSCGGAQPILYLLSAFTIG